MMQGLKDKRVLITGGAGGIGAATAQRFIEEGSRVAVIDQDEAAGTRLQRDLPLLETLIYADVADPLSVTQAFDKLDLQMGGLDILINNAGIGYSGELSDTAIATWKKLINVNLLGPLYHIYAFLPSMIERRSGHIVNISSGQAFFRLPTWGAYASIKAALGVLSEILHFELRKYKICVTTVYPFMVNTGFYSNIQSETWGSKLSMRLLPYYSYSPEKVAKIIFEAVRKKKRIEMSSILNDLAFYARVLPGFTSLMGATSNFFLARKA
jgi:NAD(P)-dependent dehydrogenase (short-subunit alcohol dehydrogenase family)